MMNIIWRIKKRISSWLDSWSPWRLRKHLYEMTDYTAKVLAELKEAEEYILEMRTQRDDAFAGKNEANARFDKLQERYDAYLGVLGDIGSLSFECRELAKMADRVRTVTQTAVEEHSNIKDMTFDEAINAMRAGKKCYPIGMDGLPRDFSSMDEVLKGG